MPVSVSWTVGAKTVSAAVSLETAKGLSGPYG